MKTSITYGCSIIASFIATREIIAAALAIPALLFAVAARAQSIWDDEGGTSNWTEGANWVGDVAPSPGDTLFLQFGNSPDAVSTSVANGPNPWTLNRLDITDLNTNYFISGNLLRFVAGAAGQPQINVNSPLTQFISNLIQSDAGMLTISSVGAGQLTLANTVSVINGGSANIQGNTAVVISPDLVHAVRLSGDSNSAVLEGTGNTIIRNTAVNCGNHYEIAASNFKGTEVATEAAMNSAANSNVNLAIP